MVIVGWAFHLRAPRSHKKRVLTSAIPWPRAEDWQSVDWRRETGWNELPKPEAGPGLLGWERGQLKRGTLGYSLEWEQFSGSQVSGGFSWKKLLERGLKEKQSPKSSGASEVQ